MPGILLPIGSIIVLGIVVIYRALYAGTPRRPPGPPQRFFGLFDHPVSNGAFAPRAFADLQKRYGPVISFYQGRTLVVVLGTFKAATDLLEKRGGTYSNRPRNIMGGELLAGNMRGVVMPYGKRWRNWRALMQAGLGIESSNNYKPVQTFESAFLLHDLLSEKDYKRNALHLRRYAVSVVFCVAYGKRIESLDDPLVLANLKAADAFIKLSTPGKYMVESMPILLKLPKLMQWFAKEPLRQRAVDTELYLLLLNNVRKQMEAGTARPSTARRALEKQGEFGLSDVETAYCVSAPFGAGLATVLSTLDVFLMAMLHHPEIMKKAQAEIDRVVGRDRLPQFDDAESLSYVKALVLETMRWRPTSPIGIPHSIISDDIYEGMHVPEGSTIIANAYAMSKDEEYFASPEEYIPDRYLEIMNSNPNGPQSTFFFGILWAFDVVPPKDEKGNEILPSTDDFVGGLTITPRPFGYLLKERGPDVRGVVLEEWRRASEDTFDWK
ncbi:hypothetical protein D9613_012488 [Agrocybe pediades]|uniref:Cytochrome P450 n=1 Tax=Agrocybe pediades TaxID=84607 RepID=A0A8H4QRJ3_9AGAR|nr:hypothetical protein D9613_012488 [Agrocybe pediades]